MHRRILQVFSLLTIAFTIALVGLSLVIAANAVTQSVAPGRLTEQIRKAFKDGALPQKATQALDRQRGALLYNDCLILGMAINRAPGLPIRIVSPALFESVVNPEINSDTCAILYDVVVMKNGQEYRSLPYHRYIAGFVPLAAAMVTEQRLIRVKHTLLLVNYLALLALCIAGLAQCTRAWREGSKAPFYLLVLPLILLVFSGVEFYAQNLSIGIADLGLYALIALLFYAHPERWPKSALAIIAASFGVFIGVFEFFTGQIPVLLALPVALLAMKACNQQELKKAIDRGLTFSFCAAAAMAFLFLQKISLALAVAGSDVVTSFAHQLAVRVGGLSYSVSNMILYMAGRADRIGQGSLAFGLAHALLATSAGLLGLFWLGRRGGFPFYRALTIAASMSAIVLWHIVFRNHSTIHSEFMVRSTSFVFASGWIIGGFALVAWASERASTLKMPTSPIAGGPSRPR